MKKFRRSCEYFFAAVAAISCMHATAQVQVSLEPYHKPVLVNKYLRLLNVVLPPGDTTQFHIHSTPSLFVFLSNTKMTAQIPGQPWVEEDVTAGTTWYRSFAPVAAVHRVTTSGAVALHVNDIELLSAFDSANAANLQPLPYTILQSSDKAFAYKLTEADVNEKWLKARRPLVLALVAGTNLLVNNTTTRQKNNMQPGDYIYIEPGATFKMAQAAGGSMQAVLFEIK